MSYERRLHGSIWGRSIARSHCWSTRACAFSPARSGNIIGTTEARIGLCVAAFECRALRHAQRVRRRAPRTAAQHDFVAVARALRIDLLRARVVVAVVAISRELPDITGHVE